MPMPITEKLIQRQINHWNSLREFLQDPDVSAVPLRGPIITISRQTGSGGRLLATALAERLGLKVHDRSLVEEIARDRKLEHLMISELDEGEINQARLWVQGVLNQRIFMRDQYRTALVKVVTGLAAKGSVVFLGRGADFILGQNATLRIRVVASQAIRLENIRQRTGLSRAEARAILDETDRQRSEFIRKIFQENSDQSGNYDLVINTDRISTDCQVEMVLLAMLEQQTARPALVSEDSPETQTARG